MLFRGIIGLLGFVTVILGTALIFRHWSVLVQGLLAFSGPVIAVLGLVLMFYASITPGRQ